jgi:hypothetical protein
MTYYHHYFHIRHSLLNCYLNFIIIIIIIIIIIDIIIIITTTTTIIIILWVSLFYVCP